MKKTAGLSLRQVMAALEELAPPALAESWDQTGLMLAPSKPKPIHRILLTIDLTDAVLREALKEKTDLIIAYHPPLFTPVQRLTPHAAREKRLIRCLEAGVSVYAPHTALDTAEHGLNDWLAEGVMDGDPDAQRTVIASPDRSDGLGPGRLLTFSKPITRAELVRRIKRVLRVRTLRVAWADRTNPRVRSLALCAGSGYSAMSDTRADAYFTGEMKHHDILAALDQQTDVLLAEHTLTERGYLPVLQRRLKALLDRRVEIRVARTDASPLRVA